MIRKLFFLIALIFTCLWFAGAYVIKERVVKLVKGMESDNVKISFADIRISGFPGKWAINLVSPKLTFIDHIKHKEISCGKLVFVTNYGFKRATLIIGKQIVERQGAGTEEIEYFFNSEQPLKAVLKFNKPLYAVGDKENLLGIVKELKFSDDSIKAVYQNNTILTVDNVTVNINKGSLAGHDITEFKFAVICRGDGKVWDFGAANLNFDMVLSGNSLSSFVGKSGLWYDSVEIKELFLAIDGAKVRVKGAVQLQNNSPQGRLSMELADYQGIVDKLWPAEFFVSKGQVKEMLEEAAYDSDSTKPDIAFDLEISGREVRIIK